MLIVAVMSIYAMSNVPLKDLESMVPKPRELAGRPKVISSGAKMTTAVVAHFYSEALLPDQAKRLEKELVQEGFTKSVGALGYTYYTKRYPGLMSVTRSVSIDSDGKVACHADRSKW